MTQNSAVGRPPQVTIAGWIATVSSVFLVTGMFDAVGRLRSIDSREAIEKGLSEKPLDGLGLNLDEALSLLHGVFVVAGGLAAAAAVLGWFVLRRHRAARIWLTVVAVPIFVSGFVSGSLLSSMVAVSAMLLWSGPSRDWFAGRPIRKPLLQMAPPTAPPTPPAPVLPPVGPGVASDVPPAYSAYGAPHPATMYGAVAPRPPALIAAAVITWIASATVVLLFGGLAIMVAADPDIVRQAIEQEPRLDELGLSLTEIRQFFMLTSVLMIGWAVVAATLALLVMLRVGWARLLLIVSAVTSGLLSFVMVTTVLPIVTAVAGMVTAYLLLRPEVSRWLSRR